MKNTFKKVQNERIKITKQLCKEDLFPDGIYRKGNSDAHDDMDSAVYHDVDDKDFLNWYNGIVLSDPRLIEKELSKSTFSDYTRENPTEMKLTHYYNMVELEKRIAIQDVDPEYLEAYIDDILDDVDLVIESQKKGDTQSVKTTEVVNILEKVLKIMMEPSHDSDLPDKVGTIRDKLDDVLKIGFQSPIDSYNMMHAYNIASVLESFATNKKVMQNKKTIKVSEYTYADLARAISESIADDSDSVLIETNVDNMDKIYTALILTNTRDYEIEKLDLILEITDLFIKYDKCSYESESIDDDFGHKEGDWFRLCYYDRTMIQMLTMIRNLQDKLSDSSYDKDYDLLYKKYKINIERSLLSAGNNNES